MLNCIMFYDDRGRWWQPGNYLTKVIDSSSHINIYNHGVIPEDISILSTIEKIKPKIDFILVVDSGKTHHKLHHHTKEIQNSGAKTAIWLSDTHLGFEDRKQWITQFRYNYVFVAQKDAIPVIIEECKYRLEQVVWLPHAVDEDIFCPNQNIQKRFDAVSVGFMNDNRASVFPELKKIINFQFKTTIWAWSVAKAYQESKLGINIPVSNDPLNMRCFEIGACKIPQIITYPQGDSNGLFELFDDGKDVLTAETNDIDRIKELAVKLVINSQLREELSENMYQKIINNHTYKHRLNVMLETMGFDKIA